MSLSSIIGSGGELVITSGSRLTIEESAELLGIIRESLASSDRVVFEFDPSVELDITCLQTLCSACRTAVSAGKTFSYRGTCPQALTALIDRCGASRHAVCKQNNNLTCTWFGGAN